MCTLIFFVYLLWAFKTTHKFHRVLSKYEAKFGVINNNKNAEKYKSVKVDKVEKKHDNKLILSKEKDDVKEAKEDKIPLVVKDEPKSFRERRDAIKNKSNVSDVSKEEIIPKPRSSTCTCACNCSVKAKEQPR